MGKTIGKIALGVGLVALSLTGVGAVGASALAFAVGVTGTTLATIGTIAAGLALTAGISVITKGLAASAAGHGVPSATLSRLTLSLDPNTPRKMVFGTTALGTDIIYQETSGTNQEYVDYIIACAAHEVTSFDSIYSDNALMWTSAGGVQGIYVGYLTVTMRPVGTLANGIAINGGTVWTTACTLTGCAYIHLRIKRTGSSSKVDSPFSGGLPARMTIIGKGMKVYDPRRDSTNGGSGVHRPDDQTTWEYSNGGAELGQNHALQALTALLGWRIGGVVSVGGGIDPARIDFADWITAANICDEAVALLPSGTQRRYEGAGIFADSDSIATVLGVMCLHMNAELRDVSGGLGIRIAHNDLTSLPVFTLNDVLGAYTYDQYTALADTPSEVRGQYVDATTDSLYQLTPYTTEAETPIDGIDRPTTLDLAMCQDPTRAARIARQVLRRGLFAARFTADFGARAWGLSVGDPLELTFGPAGLVSQKFRVERQELKVVLSDDDAQTLCPMTLVAEDDWIYQWDGVATMPDAAVPTIAYNPQNAPNAVKVGSDIGVDDGATNVRTYRTAWPPPLGRDADLWFDTRHANKGWRFEAGALVSVEYAGATITYGGATIDYTSGAWVEVDDTSIVQAQRTANAKTGLVAQGSARDTDVVSFSLPAAPKIIFGSGGISAPSGANTIIDASGLSATGFTMRAVYQTVGTVTGVTDTGAVAGVSGEPDLVINRSTGTAPFDGRFTFTYSVTIAPVRDIAPGEPGEPGSITISCFVKRSGAWIEVSNAFHNLSGTFQQVVSPGTVDFGASAEFGVSVTSQDGVARLTGFTSVAYATATVSGETTLTPSNSSAIQWSAWL